MFGVPRITFVIYALALLLNFFHPITVNGTGKVGSKLNTVQKKFPVSFSSAICASKLYKLGGTYIPKARLLFHFLPVRGAGDGDPWDDGDPEDDFFESGDCFKSGDFFESGDPPFDPDVFEDAVKEP